METGCAPEQESATGAKSHLQEAESTAAIRTGIQSPDQHPLSLTDTDHPTQQYLLSSLSPL